MFAGARTATIAARRMCTCPPLNFGAYPMGNGLTRLATRFLGEPDSFDAGARTHRRGAAMPRTPKRSGWSPPPMTTSDWDDEVRLMLEERASFSPDALTAMEANLRFAGPETMETRIFGRLTAWQNWMFQRPNAVGDDGFAEALRQRVSGRTTTRSEIVMPDGTAVDYNGLIPNNVGLERRSARAQGAGDLASRLHRLVAADGTGRVPGQPGLSAHRGRRRLGRLGEVRLRADAGVSLGRAAGAGGRGPHHSVRRAQGRAGLAGGARRVSRHAAPPAGDPGRHRTRVGGTAAASRRHRAVATTTCATCSR